MVAPSEPSVTPADAVHHLVHQLDIGRRAHERQGDQVGAQFLPWTCANEKALAASQEEFSVTLGDKIWTQKPQKYHARSLGVLRARYAGAPDKAALDPVLDAAGCLAGLRG